MLVALQLVTLAAVPLKLTEPLPCVEPKLVPVIVTDVPTVADVGDRLVILGAETTVKLLPALSTPFACRTTFPVVAPEGTVTTTLVSLQLDTVALVPLNLTVLLPCVAPKLEPATVTAAPTAPVVGVRVEIVGVPRTVKLRPFVFTPLAFTMTFPVVAPVGTLATMLVALQLVIVAVVPLNFTFPLPWVAPMLEPAIVIEAPTAPEFGVRLDMLGVASTVNALPLLAVPLTVTTTFPVVAPLGTTATILVALHDVTLAVVLLNLTVLVPCVDPKLVPAMVIEAPIAPEDGVRVEIVGAAEAGFDAKQNTVNETKRAHKYRIRRFMDNPQAVEKTFQIVGELIAVGIS